MCQEDFCEQLTCGTSDSVCYDYDTQSLLPLMECRSGYCEKQPCRTVNDCVIHYPLNGPYECREGMCERIQCEDDDNCGPYRTCNRNRLCVACGKAPNTRQTCEGMNIVETYYSYTERCQLETTSGGVVETCQEGEICKEEIDASIPENVWFRADCVPAAGQ